MLGNVSWYCQQNIKESQSVRGQKTDWLFTAKSRLIADSILNLRCSWFLLIFDEKGRGKGAHINICVYIKL